MALIPGALIKNGIINDALNIYKINCVTRIKAITYYLWLDNQ